ncbi:MAG: hypothetical protein IJ802_03600, partial [Kiritimatiellae bacterium]|nr:hypothetical protein [Kiritimatiellia bacterium]
NDSGRGAAVKTQSAERKVSLQKEKPIAETPLPKGSVAEVEENERVAKDEVREVLSVQTNSAGYIVERVVDASGKKRLRVKEPPSMWEFATDRLISAALQTPDDQELPPWPPMDETDEEMFLRSLETPMKYLPTDTEEERRIKRLVELAREDIRERIEDGMSFAEVLHEHRVLANENGKMRLGIMKEYREILASGDGEGAERFRIAMNEALAKIGIREIEAEE